MDPASLFLIFILIIGFGAAALVFAWLSGGLTARRQRRSGDREMTGDTASPRPRHHAAENEQAVELAPPQG